LTIFFFLRQAFSLAFHSNEMFVMEKFILSFDQGTTSSRAIVFNHAGAMVSVAQKEFTQYFPKPGWVEHDPKQIWSTQAGVAAEAVAKAGIKAIQIAAIGITNQRETTIVWNRETGEPVYNAIVWQDRRTAELCDAMRKKNLAKKFFNKTGLVLDAYFSGTKVKWILDNVKGARKLAEQGKLAFGTVDSWLVWNLTKGALHITDVSNASRTLLFNIKTLQWDKELCDLLNVPMNMLPDVRSSSELYGNTAAGLFAHNIPIAGIAGDQQAALFGQMCTSPGMVKNTYGTGCFMLMNTGDKPVFSKHNLLTTVGWRINGKTTYALEGSVFIAGAVVQWLRDGLKLIHNSGEVESLAGKCANSEGVYVVPAFVGLGAPHWNQHARGMIVGITRGTTDAHIARASIESIAYQTCDVLQAMQNDSKMKIKQLRVDGGATANNLLMQFQSDVLGTSVVRPEVTETTALGAAYLAGLAVGFWKSQQQIAKQWKMNATFKPKMKKQTVDALMKGWQKAVHACKQF
jgi:glycerol kinase